MIPLFSNVIPDFSQVPEDGPVAERARVLVETLSAYMEEIHGGGMDYVSFDGARLQIRLSGACEECGLSTGTVRGWVEGTARQFFPDLEIVEAV